MQNSMRDNKNRADKGRVIHDKKQGKDISGVIIGLIGGAIIGYFMVSFMPSDEEKVTVALPGMILLFVLSFFIIYLGFSLHVLMHEAGHLIAGIISGYDFISFRIYNMIFIKENGKLIKKKFAVAGTGGQCLMVPPESAGEQFPFILYNLGGSLMNFIGSGLFVAFYFIFAELSSRVAAVTIFMAGAGILTALYNLIPLKIGGISNDGYNALILSKKAGARRAFRIVLLTNSRIVSGQRYKDMPFEWFTLPEDFNDPLSASLAILHFNYLADSQRMEEARTLAQKILDEGDKVLELHKQELRCELLFYEIIGERRREEIDRLYTKELKRYIKAGTTQISKLRLQYAYERLVAHNDDAAEAIAVSFRRTCLRYPHIGEIAGEQEAMAVIDSRCSRSPYLML